MADELDTENVAQLLANLNTMGARASVAIAPHNDIKGWQADIAFAHRFGGQPRNLVEMLTGGSEDDGGQTDPHNPDHNHVIQIRIWDPDYETAVRRCAKSFFAAYSASISEVGLSMNDILNGGTT